MHKQKKALVAVLNWGLGHATRSIPVIDALLKNNISVVIASDGSSMDLLRDHYPSIPFYLLPGYNIKYASPALMPFAMLFQLPSMMRSIRKENELTREIVEKENIELIISDNRYGVYSNSCRNIIITHQLMIKSPSAYRFSESTIHKIILNLIAKFDNCWIPDVPDFPNLCGDLAHKYPLPDNAKFIGPLSRLKILPSRNPDSYELIFIISGPEPQRTNLENIVFEQVRSINMKSLIIKGLPGEGTHLSHFNENIDIMPHVHSNKINELLNNTNLVISRSGYSTIMDLVTLRLNAVFIPTPGQTEQEYLADYHKSNKVFYSEKQKSFDLAKAIEASKIYSVDNLLKLNAKSFDVTNLL